MPTLNWIDKDWESRSMRPWDVRRAWFREAEGIQPPRSRFCFIFQMGWLSQCHWLACAVHFKDAITLTLANWLKARTGKPVRVAA
jgi:hypothetical protein